MRVGPRHACVRDIINLVTALRNTARDHVYYTHTHSKKFGFILVEFPHQVQWFFAIHFFFTHRCNQSPESSRIAWLFPFPTQSINIVKGKPVYK